MNTLGSMETIKHKRVQSQGAPVEGDPAAKMKEEGTKRLEGLINDLGKTMQKLLEGSEEHEELTETAKLFSKHEGNISKTEKTLIQMQGSIAELTAVLDHMQTNVQKIPQLCAMYDGLPVAKDEYMKSADKSVIKF